MQNNYTIKDNVVEIEIFCKDEILYTLIDLKFLPVLEFMNIKWYAYKRPKGKQIYVRGCYKGEYLYMHHIAHGKQKGMVIDHINKNSLDNRENNLRLVSYAVNAVNRINMHRPNSKSKERFIHWNEKRSKYQVCVYSTDENKRKRKYLGYFTSLDEAISIRDSYLFK
jgi:hypothetical protein